jgi:hypothetical protein
MGIMYRFTRTTLESLTLRFLLFGTGMTKPLTCVAALVCYEMGYYELDDPVSR